MKFPAQVRLRDVTLRDGLQNEAAFVPTEQKWQLLDQLLDAGFTRIEATSFVHPARIPALRDADELVARLPQRPGVEYSVLVPNSRGFDRFLASSVQTAVFFLSASSAHNLNNVNRTSDESLQEIAGLVEETVRAGRQAVGAIATSFVCPFDGIVPLPVVERVAKTLVERGVKELAIADTIGRADPRMVYERCSHLRQRFPDVEISLHLHDPMGYGLANLMAGIQAGIEWFDVAQAGLGGCPYAPGAPGNLQGSRVVEFLERQGIATGINLSHLQQLDVSFQKAVSVGQHDNSGEGFR